MKAKKEKRVQAIFIVLIAVALLSILLVQLIVAQEQTQQQTQAQQATQEQQAQQQQKTQTARAPSTILPRQQQPAVRVSLPVGADVTQDFLVQVVDYQPKVVRSDLLEEQDIPVFAKLALTQINPIIDVSRISSITVSQIPELEGEKFPSKFVSGVFWNPPPQGKITTENAGYAIVRLRGGIPEEDKRHC